MTRWLFQRAPVNKGVGNCSPAGGDHLAPLNYCSIGIEVVPGTVGPRTASYRLETNDPITPTITIPLTLAQRQTLLAWQRATSVPSGMSRRARMILLLAEGR